MHAFLNTIMSVYLAFKRPRGFIVQNTEKECDCTNRFYKALLEHKTEKVKQYI